MAMSEDPGSAPVATHGTFCPECGQENPPQRGACVMCFALLHQSGGGLPCPHCGDDNPKDAQFCQNCGTALGGRTKPKTISEAAMAVLHGGVAGLTADHEEDEGGFYEEDEGGFLGGEEASVPASPPPPPAPVPAPAPVYEEEEEDMGMGPSALALEEQSTPPPPPAPPPAEEP